jgi:glutamate--cysteine ligase
VTCGRPAALTRAALAADLAERAFGRPPGGVDARRVGAEVELIPVEAGTGRRCGLLAPFLRRYGASRGWREGTTDKGVPCFALPEGRVTFEPGGQIEYATPPCRSAAALLALLRAVVPPLRTAAADEGIELLTVGMDPFNPLDRAPILVPAERYRRMARHFARRGPSGGRMMRQTAAFQLTLDPDDARLRWRVLNAAAPYVVAAFANSPVYAGEETGCRSARADAWRRLDPSRTGLPWDGNRPVEVYLDFALAADAFLLSPGGEARPFADRLGDPSATPDDWHDHLTTLFPEVRPRRALELRSADALPPEWYAAPVALAAGLCYDPASLRDAVALLGPPDPALLEPAGRDGLRDPGIARTAADLAELALAGCERLGPAFFAPADLDDARAFFDRYTRRGRAPADDAVEAVAAA